MNGLLVSAVVAVVLLNGCGASTEAPTANDAAPVLAQGGNWRVDYENSRLGFTASQNGVEFKGAFQSFEAVIDFDPEDLANAKIRVVVDMNSANTGDRQRDGALPGSDWFATRDHPQATFISSDIRAGAEPDSYEALGELTIREARNEIRLPFTLQIDGDAASARGETVITRTDYGVGRGEFATDEWVGFEVTIDYRISASR